MKPDSPFWYYNTNFDAGAVIQRHAAPNLQASPGFLTNYLGVRIDPKFFPNILTDVAGQVEGIPIPANWHADIAEWAAALRSVELARNKYTIVELGCGWGCWMNNTGLAARRLGLKVHVIGVEGDEGHIDFAKESLQTNGFSKSEISLYRGIAAASSGIALFPRQHQAGISWGLEPVFGASEKQRAAALRTGDFDELPMISLADIAKNHDRIDLLHVDIQGGEADLIEGCLNILREKFAYLVIGTHSRQIEGRIFNLLLNEGWRLDIERPAILRLSDSGPVVTVDGVQGWRNSRLLPNSDRN